MERDLVPLSPEYHAQLPDEAILLLGSLALSMGVYDASQDTYEVMEHPEDDLWAIRGNN